MRTSRCCRPRSCILLVGLLLVVPALKLCLVSAFQPQSHYSISNAARAHSPPAFSPIRVPAPHCRRTNVNTSPSKYPPSSSATGASTSTALCMGKAWDKLNIDPDVDRHWYMLNCVAGSELELLAQCNKILSDGELIDPDDSDDEQESEGRHKIKFVVPQQRQLRSHGRRNVVDVKALYPGYVFVHLRLTAHTYERIAAIPLTRSWMGTVHMKGNSLRRLPVIPVSLNEEEIEKFQLLEEETDALFAKYGADYDGRGDEGTDLLDQYAGYEVDSMVKVLVGKHKGEDGVVKRLKDGRILVRLYTYGTTFDEWYDSVEDIRPMTDVEVLKGLTGPEGPIKQEDFDVSIGRKPRERSRERGGGGRGRGSERSLRSDLYSSMGPGSGRGAGGGAGGQRNTRFDRQARGERGGSSSNDRFGRSDAQLEEEERNWREYREQQRSGDQQQRGQQQQRAEKKQGTWGMDGARPDWTYDETKDITEGDDDAMGEVDAQWGRDSGGQQQQQQQRRMSNRRGGRQWQDAGPRGQRQSQSTGIESALDGDGDWTSFAGGSGGGAADSGSGSGGSESDDFFDSLLNELSDTLESSSSGSDAAFSSRPPRGGTAAAPGGSSNNADDDFFSSLIDGLSDSLDEAKSEVTSPRASLDGDGGGPPPSSPSSGGPGSGTTADDDFFASLEADLDDVLGATSSTAGSSASAENDFFSDLADDLFSTGELASTDADKSQQKSKGSTSSSSSQNLSGLTVPVLKGMLKERGLKVSGKKSDLIERLSQ